MHIDYDKCAGHAVCEGVDPQVFRIGDDGFTHLLVDCLDDDKRDLMNYAAEECPTGALTVRD